MTTPAPPCQSDLDVVPEMVALARITSQDVRIYVYVYTHLALEMWMDRETRTAEQSL